MTDKTLSETLNDTEFINIDGNTARTIIMKDVREAVKKLKEKLLLQGIRESLIDTLFDEIFGDELGK